MSTVYTNKPKIDIIPVPQRTPLKNLTQTNITISQLLSSSSTLETTRPGYSYSAEQSTDVHVQNELHRAPFTQQMPSLGNSMHSNNANVSLDSRPNFKSQPNLPRSSIVPQNNLLSLSNNSCLGPTRSHVESSMSDGQQITNGAGLPGTVHVESSMSDGQQITNLQRFQSQTHIAPPHGIIEHSGVLPASLMAYIDNQLAQRGLVTETEYVNDIDFVQVQGSVPTVASRNMMREIYSHRVNNMVISSKNRQPHNSSRILVDEGTSSAIHSRSII